MRQIEEIVLDVTVQANKALDELKALYYFSDKVDANFKKLRGTAENLDKELDDEKAAAYWAQFTAGQNKAISGNKRFTQSLKRMGKRLIPTRMAALAMAGALTKLGHSSIEATKKMDKLRAGMNTVFGETGNLAQESKYLNGIIEELGLDVVSATQGFVKIAAATQGTAIQGEQTRQIFEGVSKAVTALSLSSEQSNGIFLAFSQIMSKGTLMAEDFMQISERIPGAFDIAAEAVGVTTEEFVKLREEGMIKAADFLPKFAKILNERFAKGAKDAAKGANAQWNLFSNAILRFLDTGGKELVKILPRMTELVDNLASGLSEIVPIIGAIIEKFTQLQDFYEGFFLAIIKTFDKEVRENLKGIEFEQERLKKQTEETKEAMEKQTKAMAEQAKQAAKLVNSLGNISEAVLDARKSLTYGAMRRDDIEELRQIMSGVTDEQFEAASPLINALLDEGDIKLTDIAKDVTAEINRWNLGAKSFKERLEESREEAQRVKDDLAKQSEIENLFKAENPLVEMMNDAIKLNQLMDFTKNLKISGRELKKLGIDNIGKALKSGLNEEQIQRQIDLLRQFGFFNEPGRDMKGSVRDAQSRGGALEAGSPEARQFLEGIKVQFEQLSYLKKIEENTKSTDRVQLVAKGNR